MRDHSSLGDLYESLYVIDKIVHNLLDIFSNIKSTQLGSRWFLFHESRDELLEYLPQNRNLYLINP